MCVDAFCFSTAKTAPSRIPAGKTSLAPWDVMLPAQHPCTAAQIQARLKGNYWQSTVRCENQANKLAITLFSELQRSNCPNYL